MCTYRIESSEAIESIRIIKDKDKRIRYYDKDKSIIKHYEFSDIFIRRTKKVFISVVNEVILNIAFSAYSDSYSSLQSSFRRMNMRLNLNYCRKVFATYLRNKGIEPEIIDLLQGRISSSVFVNHYYRADINEIITKKIRPVLDELLEELID